MKRELLIGLSWLGSLTAMAGGGTTPPAYEVDTVFSSTRNARSIYVANNKLNSYDVVQDEAGNVWIGGSYDDNNNNFYKAMVAAFNGTSGAPLTSYNTTGVYYHNQYDYDFVRSIYSVRGGKVYAAFTTQGGALLDANSSGLGINKVGFGAAPQARAYAQRNDSTIVGVTAMGGANPSQNRFYTYNAVKGTDFNTHLFADYYNGNASSFNANLYAAKVLAMQPDGKMLVATTPFEVYRYKANSSDLDSTFGNNGYAYIAPNNPPNTPCDAPQAADILVQPDGSILYLLGNGAYSQLYRLDGNGAVDNTFANNMGVITINMSYTATTPCTYSGTVCSKMVRLSNGKIILGGTELANTSITYTYPNLGVTFMNGSGLGFYAYNADGTPDYDFGGGSNYQRINIWNSGLTNYEYPQLNEMYVNANNEIFVTGRYAVGVAGSPSAEDAAFVTKLKPVQSANLCANFSFDIDATPANNQDGSNGVITIDNVTGTAPYVVTITLNGNQLSSGTFSTLPIYIDDVQSSVNGYDIQVSNADGCANTANALVAACYSFAATVATQGVSASGNCDGAATINLSGSWGGPYTAESASLLINTQFNTAPYLLSNTLCVGTGYTVTVTDGYGCQTTATFDVTQGCVAPPVPVLTQSNDTLFASTVGVSGGYDWYLNGNILATTAFPTNYLVVTQNGSYTVIAGNGPCTSALSDPLVVTTVGISNVATVAVNLYPNPATQQLMLQSEEPVKAVEVYNATGERVLYKTGPVTQLDVTGLSNGLYSVRVVTTMGNYAVKTFAKQ